MIELTDYDIIMISGGINSGKDTVANHLKSYCELRHVDKKFAYRVKQFASLLLNVPVALFEDRKFKNSILPIEWKTKLKHNYLDFNIDVNYTVRDMMVIIGDGMRKVLHPDCWAIALMNEYEAGDKWIITDFRYNNEYEVALKHNKSILKIFVDRKQDINYSYGSENGFSDIQFDVVIDNNSTLEDLFKKELPSKFYAACPF